MKVGAVVAAAGSGSRFGREGGKLWAELAGRTVLEWSLLAMCRHPAVEAGVVVTSAGDRDRVTELCRSLEVDAAVVEGGASRSDSVFAGLQALPEDVDLVLVHDAARPLVRSELVDRVLEAALEHGAAVPGIPVRDTVKRADADGRVLGTVPRDDLWTVQTPQATRRAWLVDAYRKWDRSLGFPTDEAQLLEQAGYPVHVVPGDPDNVKITVPPDLGKAERILRDRLPLGEADMPRSSCDVRVGFGYDVHRFQADRPLWLGGVRIRERDGLHGHSDADVVLHAVCDGILGAMGGGDIGRLFPDTDPANKDRASVEFVSEASRQAQAQGWAVAWIDITLVAEEPRIGPYREEMRERIAAAAGCKPDLVNIKATTSEGMGFVGRREGMACWATVTLMRVNMP